VNGKTGTHVEQLARRRRQVALPPVEQFQEAFRRLEIAELFQDAEEMGLDRLAGHILAEANLDFVTDEPFDQVSEEPAGDEPF
jgi:hypothetical protein